MEHTNLQDYKLYAEQNNRTIKNQVLTGLHRTTYKTMPRVMIKHLVVASMEKFNTFPAKCGISNCHSLETLVIGIVFDYNKHCQLDLRIMCKQPNAMT